MKQTVFLLLLIFTAGAVFAAGQDRTASADNVWREIDDASLQRRQLPRPIIPHAYRAFTLDKTALGNILRKAPMEFTETARNNSPVVTIPMPDGSFARF